MATQYRIFANDLAGGPVDYSTVVATTASPTYSPAALPAGSDATFAVRAYDTVSGLTETNVDAVVRIATDAAGADVTGLPNAPTHLSATPGAAGSMTVRWSYNPGGQGGAPTGFHVYAGTPAVSYATPAATVSHVRGKPAYSATLAALADGAAYQFAVRAYNGTGEESNTATAAAVASSTGPAAVEALAGAAVP